MGNLPHNMGAMAAPPSGKITFLFTDIVGSTEMWERHGDSFLPILQAHNAIIQDAVTRFGGYVVKTEGDCYKVAFSDAAAAARCAVVAQAALHRYPWPEDVGTLMVRMAVHSGEPFTQGGDYFGPPVNRTARMLSAAHGGQILISEDTLRQIEDHMDAGTRFVDLGTHALRDLSEPARLYQVEHTALQLHSFPPPRTLNGHANNLPLQRRSFVGREKEIEQIAALLSREDTQLVALTGPGGIGKTRLSMQAAAERVELFPDGVWLVKLENARDVNTAALEVAQTLGIRVPFVSIALETVREWLAERRCLLILDDCGSVPQADRFMRELLSGNSNLRCLATSRESLALEQAAEVHVPELSRPGDNPTAEELLASEAGRLFVERVHEGRKDFALTPPRAATIGRLLDRTRITAAIEKAAEVIKTKEPAELAGALGEEVHQMGKMAFDQGKGLFNRMRETPGFGALLQSLGSLAADQKDLAEAERRSREALAAYQQTGDRQGIAASLRQLGNIALIQKEHRRALTLLEAARQAAVECGSPEAEGISADLDSARRAAGRTAHAYLPLDQAITFAMSD